MGKGKGIPDEISVDADLTVGVNATTDTTAEMSMDTDLTVDSTMRFPDAIRTEMAVTEPIRTEMAVTEPIRTEFDMVQRMAITEPIRTEMQMDLKPVVVDLCLNLGINKLPRTCVKRPYQHRLAISVLGTEVAAVSLAGNREVIIDDLDERPSVAWGSDHAVRNPHPPASAPTDHDPRGATGQTRTGTPGTTGPPSTSGRPSGLRIDLGH